MDLTFTPKQEAFRREAREWLAAHVPKTRLRSMDTAEGFEQHRAWERTLNEGRWAMVPWPVEYGGRGADLIEWLIFEEEYYHAQAPGRVNQNGIFLLGPTLMEFGTPAQKARYLPRMACSDEVWAQGWSEPNAGSDMAAIRASARLDGDHYVLNGQKTWASRAAFADWIFGIFRTDPASERHKGLTFILVPLNAPGVRVRPIAQLDGETGFAEVFFDDVRVPAENRLGEEGQGLKVALGSLGAGRIGIAAVCVGLARNALELAARYALQRRQFGRAIADQEMIQAMLAEMAVRVDAARLLTWRAARMRDAGQPINTASSMAKWYASDTAMAVTTDAVQVYGGAGYSRDNPVERLMRDAKGAQIYEGTNQIHRLIVAQGLLDSVRHEA